MPTHVHRHDATQRRLAVISGDVASARCGKHHQYGYGQQLFDEHETPPFRSTVSIVSILSPVDQAIQCAASKHVAPSVLTSAAIHHLQSGPCTGAPFKSLKELDSKALH
ncbi:hypothetical protein [Stenotrophomonas rhizophila]|uniref:hypothetical protein n=1 Tax=Stenotrophomonas rhizophila TaxID=216778 RepID=UPI00112F24BC|nr:hypothetical protein [Stenotrophomonas rhizophila]